MTRAEFVQRLVLNEICDDFENVDQVILRAGAEVGRKCGLSIGRHDVIDALRVLVAEGLAKAYDLTIAGDSFAGEMDGMPPLDAPEEHFRTYFLVTQKGMDLQEADGTWWPLDEGALRSGWSPPDSR